MRESHPESSDREHKPPEAYRRTIIGTEDLKLIQHPSDQTPKSFRLTYTAPFQEVERHFEEGRKAVLYTSLLMSVGYFDKDDVGDRGIPLEIALDGRPAIAAYLHAVWGKPTREIAGRMGVDVETVWDYWSQVRQRARDDTDIITWEV